MPTKTAELLGKVPDSKPCLSMKPCFRFVLLGRPFGRLRPGGRQMDDLMRFTCLSICASDGSGNSVPSYCSFQCAFFNSGHMMCIMFTSAATAAACACEHGIFVRTMHRLSQAAGPPFLTSFRSTRTFLLGLVLTETIATDFVLSRNVT